MAHRQTAAAHDSTVRSMSHGRGGAGNMGSAPKDDVTTDSLQTPTIKSQNYTTGRGGTGNIVSNDSAANARMAQDVDAPPSHAKDQPTTGTYHWGRGGEGNQVTLGTNGEKKKERSTSRGEAGHEKPGFIEKAQHALGMGHKKE